MTKRNDLYKILMNNINILQYICMCMFTVMRQILLIIKYIYNIGSRLNIWLKSGFWVCRKNWDKTSSRYKSVKYNVYSVLIHVVFVNIKFSGLKGTLLMWFLMGSL